MGHTQGCTAPPVRPACRAETPARGPSLGGRLAAEGAELVGHGLPERAAHGLRRGGGVLRHGGGVSSRRSGIGLGVARGGSGGGSTCGIVGQPAGQLPGGLPGTVGAGDAEVYLAGHAGAVVLAHLIFEPALGQVVGRGELNALREGAVAGEIAHLHVEHLVVHGFFAGALPEAALEARALQGVGAQRGGHGAALGQVGGIEVPSGFDVAVENDVDLSGAHALITYGEAGLRHCRKCEEHGQQDGGKCSFHCGYRVLSDKVSIFLPNKLSRGADTAGRRATNWRREAPGKGRRRHARGPKAA